VCLRSKALTALAAALCVLLAGCGTRLGEAEIAASAGGETIRLTDDSLAWFANPWIFPDAAAPIDTVVGFIKHGVERGKKKLGVLYCVEAGACTENTKLIRDGAAAEAGAELVYDSPVSVTQPDYTAQCINARNAGVDQLTLGMDGASMGRVVKSCASIGYRPLISTVAGLISPAQSKDPMLREFGVVTASGNAPWTERDTPGLQEFHRALARWAPQLPPDGASLFTWSGAKLFEAALGNVEAEARSGPVTPSLLMKGLGMIKNNTLGGLTGPITFSLGQQHATSSRWRRGRRT
jgi:branched-chain amino acid transport system substrate-binding protein